MTFNQKLNALSRMIILLSVLGYLLFRSLKFLFMGISELSDIIVVKFSNFNTEGYSNIQPIDVMDENKQNEDEMMKEKMD